MKKNRILIPIGEYYISAKPDEELITVAGSCVAVTVYDKTKQIGGMLHIVLPGKRAKLRKQKINTYYADTGIHILIEEMIKKGVKLEHISANIIGGASSGTIKDDNNIGRKNVETALRILHDKKIEIDKINTGGRYSYKILLNIESGELKITKNKLGNKTQPEGNIITDKAADKLVKRIKNLKPGYHTTYKLINYINLPSAATENILNIISEDVVLACHIMSMCNSSYYGIPGKISSIPDAVRLLGKKKFRLICIVAATRRHRGKSLADYGQPEEDINLHFRACAIISRYLALQYVSPDKSEEAFTAGLLRGVSLLCVILLNSKKKKYNCFEYSYNNPHIYKIGEIILTKLNIPERLIKAATGLNNKTGSSSMKTFTAVINASCWFVQFLGIGFNWVFFDTDLIENALKKIGLTHKIERFLPKIYQILLSFNIIKPLHKAGPDE